jgi:hypothetical protein
VVVVVLDELVKLVASRSREDATVMVNWRKWKID